MATNRQSRRLATGHSTGQISRKPPPKVDPTLGQCKKLMDKNRQQYIVKHDESASGLPYSAKFRFGHMLWKLHGEECLVTIGSGYVARVTIGNNIPLKKLDDESNFIAAKRTLMKHLKIEKVLLDEWLQKIEKYAADFKTELKNIAAESATQSRSAECLLQIMQVAEKYKCNIGFDFVREICKGKLVHNKQLKIALVMFVAAKSSFKKRYTYQRIAKLFDEWNRNFSFLQEFLSNLLDQHKSRLLSSCSPQIKNILETLESKRCLLVQMVDLDLFRDLECAPNDSVFSAALPKIANNLINRIATLESEKLRESFPVADAIYFYIWKSLMDISKCVEAILGISNVIQYTGDKWQMAALEALPSQAARKRCLVEQLRMLVEMANHFEPGKVTVRIGFPYSFRNKQFERTEIINNQQHLWLCLTDATLANIFANDFADIEEFGDILYVFGDRLKSEYAKYDSQESLRIMTHNILEFVARGQESKLRSTGVGKDILRMQICFMNNENTTFDQYRDAIDVFNEYQKLINDNLSHLPGKLRSIYFQPNIDKLQNKLLDIPLLALRLKVQLVNIVRFFRAYNDLLTDFMGLSLEWYVRIASPDIKQFLIEKKYIECVRNRLKQTANECYLVLEYEAFVQATEAEGVPQHYQVEIHESILDFIINLLTKHRWSQDTLTEGQLLHASILLINAIRSCLPYLKEQPEYLDFRKYYEECSKPFINVIEESVSLKNFSERVAQIETSFWYSRNQIAVGIDEALTLCQKDNTNFNDRLLRESFKRYKKQFEQYMSNYHEKDPAELIDNIVKDVENNVQPKPFTEWHPEFKRSGIPKIVAGVGAVWSILVSEDVSKSGHFLKPHTIQVLSILRMLSVDSYATGVENHFAQILTGQGKSVILGLTAAVLALLGHNVVIVCYSEYLVSRDSNEFLSLFEKFSINSKVSYKTFENLACEHVKPLYDKAKKHLKKGLGINNDPVVAGPTESDLSKTVLLIDEVDVFLTDKFYGGYIEPTFSPTIPGLGMVQQKIWRLVQKNLNDIQMEIHTYIANSDYPEVQKLKSLIERSQSCNVFEKDPYDVAGPRKSLLHNHFWNMITTAKDIYERKEDDNWIEEFELDPSGLITMKDDFGIYRADCLNRYSNIFIYFKLRKENFIENVNGIRNFGYLNIPLVLFSHAKIPEMYPLILGVTGTLASLNEFEKDVIENQYGIGLKSFMPSFFGSSNLRYDQQSNFHCSPEETSWQTLIFTEINKIVKAQRSVIVFFEDDKKIDTFKEEFKSKLDRLNELTVNANAQARERCIAEAGVARTVTLATSDMGRGVDYKSSTTVEENGGIHVIQTCFVTDEKEETQIKGRTARKDNHGSYELIVCYSHLVELKLIEKNVPVEEITYKMLEDSRRRMIAEKSKELETNLKKANEWHERSIKFYDAV